MAYFENHPGSGRQFANVKDALDSIKAFNALYAVNMADNNPTLCGNADDTAMWRKLVWEGVINCGGEPMELDFFEQIFGGKTESIDAKKIYFRYNDDIDMNVEAQDTAKAASAGQPVWFTLAKGLHSGTGKYSYLTKGYSLYIYEDRQWVQIVDEDKTNDYGHRFQLRPHKAAYQINVRRLKKMMVTAVRFVGGLSGPSPSTHIQSLGYTNHVKPFRIRKDWEMAIDLLRGYEEQLVWALNYDEQGKEIWNWEAINKMNARRDMKWAKNMIFFMGQSIDNPDLLGTDTGKVSTDYSGFDGYIPTMHYGGGKLIDFDPGVGFDLSADFEPVMLKNDANKQTTEYVVLHALPFQFGLNRNANEKFKNATGACTFDTFKRMGGSEEDIKQLGVKSYEYNNFSLHFKLVSALSDTRGIGNYDIPQQAHFIPGNGLKDSKGKEVPALQFFMPKGMGASGMLEENDRDHRKIDGWDKLSGDLAETLMMAIHCPHLHMLANPMKAA